jgi:ThiF family protein
MTEHPYSVAIPREVDETLRRHLIRDDGQEDLCFALWYPSRGATRTTALIHRVILPVDGDRQVHGNASYFPQYFERAIGEALESNAGIAFLHSHPGPGWQDMSGDDVRAELRQAGGVWGATDLPLVGLTLGTDGAWSARFWERVASRRYERRWCSHVRVVGEQLRPTFNDLLMPPPKFREALRRTVSAWGPQAQADLTRLTIGVVGTGSVGIIVAEALMRTGFTHVKLIDFDALEEVNLDRLLHATLDDDVIGKAKVRIFGPKLRRSATAANVRVDEIEYSICEEEGYRAALDCDLLFSCVDRPRPRAVLNFIAYAHLIPVVDGGILVGVKPNGKMRSADWKAHIASPDRRCLECIGQYDPGLVSVERDGYLDDPSYIAGLPTDHPIRRNENVFAFALALASLEFLQMLMMVVAPGGLAAVGEQAYHFVPGFMEEPRFRGCEPTCLYPGFVAKGERAGITVTGKHLAAARARAVRTALSQKETERSRWWTRLISVFRG